MTPINAFCRQNAKLMNVKADVTYSGRIQCLLHKQCVNNVRFQVLTAASMMFRVVFWDILPCKMIVD
jgi:hypothetical protein